MSRSPRILAGDAIVFAIAVVLPFHSVTSLPVGRANFSLADPILLLGWLLLLSGAVARLEIPSFGLPALGLVAAAVVSVLVLPVLGRSYANLSDGVMEVVKLGFAVSYFVLLVNLFRQCRRRRFYLFGIGTIAILTVLSLWTSIETLQGVRRPPGSFDNPNIYADYLVFGIFVTLFVIYKYYREQPYVVVLSVIPLGLALVSLLGTGSRGSFGGFVLSILAITVIGHRQVFEIIRVRSKETLLGGLVGTGGVVGIFVSGDWSIFARFREALRGESSEWNRIDIWQAHIDGFIDFPLTGMGYGQYSYYLETTSAHNTAIRILAETGLIGVGSLLVLCLLALNHALFNIIEKEHAEVIFVLGFLIATGLNSLFHDAIHFRTLWITFAILGTYVAEDVPTN